MKKASLLITILCALTINSFAQQKSRGTSLDSLNTKYLNWHNLDPKDDTIMGVSTEKAYKELLKNLTPKKEIVVAVIDAGVDVAHKDLQGKIWVNTNEIAGNGIDDDKNGYVDDINGWNFLGNAKGENLLIANIDRTRVIRKYHERFKNVKSADELSPKEAKKYKIYKRALDTHNANYDRITAWQEQTNLAKKQFIESKKILAQYLTKNPICQKELTAINPKNESEKAAKEFLLAQYKRGYKTASKYDKALEKRFQGSLKYYSNLEYKERKLIGDNNDDLSDMYYGNNKVDGDGYGNGHGTFVAGLIAANRNNGIGINGIAENVKIMAIRAVPDGDENDKDIALAIKYAIDNGADIINMSFGKYYSSNKEMVDSILEYANSKNVLLFTSAGNSAIDNDKVDKFPKTEFENGGSIKNWITVGASSKDNKHKRLAGIFSNYGKKNVEFFAPGVRIISTYPQSTYRLANGTSFSSPIAAGVAALVWSYYPELTALQLKEVLLKSAEKCTQEVLLPGKGKKETNSTIPFADLSVTGGIVNAYKALQEADKIVNKK